MFPLQEEGKRIAFQGGEMTRKMLAEEKDLRNWIRWATCDFPDNEERRFALKALTALVKAVRLDEQLRNQCGCDVCVKERGK